MQTHEFDIPENTEARFVTPRPGPHMVLLVAESMGVPTEVYEGDGIILPTFEASRMDKAIEGLRRTAARMDLDHIHLVKQGDKVGAFAYSARCDLTSPK